MTNARILSIAELKKFLTTSSNIVFKAKSPKESYQWIEDMLYLYGYRKRKKKEKGIIQNYLQKMTGYSKAQIKRLTSKWLKTGRIYLKSYQRHSFPKQYSYEDILLLAEVDNAHLTLSGQATKTILKREYSVFNKEEYAQLANISVSHLYNLRGSFTYREKAIIFNKTKKVNIPIGERKKPEPNNQPGFIRVDTVHQGDDPETGKGVYHINFVDEVTQWELIAAVETISKRHLLPILEAILKQFPFIIINFHADNGSEYINKLVAQLLNKLHINLTKSRPRHSNDNALAETKNGAVIRKHMGYHHIPQTYAGKINEWYQKWFNIYLNFHRPCAYPKIICDHKGKEKHIYPQENYMVPYEKLKLLPKATKYLKAGITFVKLDKIAYNMSDTEFAKEMQKTKQKLFTELKYNNQTKSITKIKKINKEK